jgi:hypothetical protein
LDLNHVACCIGSARYILVAAENTTISAILPGIFDDGDFYAWLREFDACCAANG